MGVAKQDRQGARTVSDLERRYGKKFSEYLGIIDETRNSVSEVESSLTSEIQNLGTTIYRDMEKILATATDADGKATEALLKAGTVNISVSSGRGVLSTVIDGTGTWESKYTVNGYTQSGIEFDFYEKEFTFTGRIVADSGRIGDCDIVDGRLEVPAANITGELTFGDGSYYINPGAEENYLYLPGLSITSDGAEFDGKIVADSGNIGGWNIGTITAKSGSTLIYSGEALYSNNYAESVGAYVGYMVRIALTPQYLVIFGYSNSGVPVAAKKPWTQLISS